MDFPDTARKRIQEGFDALPPDLKSECKVFTNSRCAYIVGPLNSKHDLVRAFRRHANEIAASLPPLSLSLTAYLGWTEDLICMTKAQQELAEEFNALDPDDPERVRIGDELTASYTEDQTRLAGAIYYAPVPQHGDYAIEISRELHQEAFRAFSARE
jgi:hypothetical protein